MLQSWFTKDFKTLEIPNESLENNHVLNPIVAPGFMHNIVWQYRNSRAHSLLLSFFSSSSFSFSFSSFCFCFCFSFFFSSLISFLSSIIGPSFSWSSSSSFFSSFSYLATNFGFSSTYLPSSSSRMTLLSLVMIALHSSFKFFSVLAQKLLEWLSASFLANYSTWI